MTKARESRFGPLISRTSADGILDAPQQARLERTIRQQLRVPISLFRRFLKPLTSENDIDQVVGYILFIIRDMLKSGLIAEPVD